jgi:hypothetical protein
MFGNSCTDRKIASSLHVGTYTMTVAIFPSIPQRWRLWSVCEDDHIFFTCKFYGISHLPLNPSIPQRWRVWSVYEDDHVFFACRYYDSSHLPRNPPALTCVVSDYVFFTCKFLVLRQQPSSPQSPSADECGQSVKMTTAQGSDTDQSLAVSGAGGSLTLSVICPLTATDRCHTQMPAQPGLSGARRKDAQSDCVANPALSIQRSVEGRTERSKLPKLSNPEYTK